MSVSLKSAPPSSGEAPLCECGCGRRVERALGSNQKIRAGEWCRFAPGHYMSCRKPAVLKECAGCGGSVHTTQLCRICDERYCQACYLPWDGLSCPDCRYRAARADVITASTPLMVVTAAWDDGTVSAIVWGRTWRLQLDELLRIAPKHSTWKAEWRGEVAGDELGPLLQALL
jgi:hypothetical protein